MFLEIPDEALNVLGKSTADLGGQAVSGLVSNPNILIIGILLIAAAIVIFYFLKKIVVNSILGFIGWVLFMVFVGVNSSMIIPSFVISLIFGLAGVGVLLVLKFFGVM